jgi:glycosyltransferase involved in cell wall biosynthesis
MSKYIGCKNGNVCVVSDGPIINDGLKIIKLTDELENKSAKELFTDYTLKNGSLFKRKEVFIAKDMKIAFVSNWAMQCGISTYAENLFPEIIKHIKDFKLFIEKNDLLTHYNLNDRSITCWERGKLLTDLTDKIKQYDPDIILINHEYGLFPNARYWLSFLTQISKYRTIIILHSVFHHLDKTICEAPIAEVIVHLDGAKKILKDEKKISGDVYVIPHGCYKTTTDKKLWNLYKSEHTIIHQGFGFHYKGFHNSICVVKELKKKYSDIFLTILFSETEQNKTGHQLYYNELIQLIDQLELRDNIAIIRGFQSEEVIDSYLRTNNVALFPYISDPKHEVFGASGAARLAFSKGIAVVSSDIPHFSDLPTIKADNIEDMACEIDKLFSNRKLMEEQISKQFAYITDNSWENTAKKFISVFERTYG